jgi:phage terminase large subunit
MEQRIRINPAYANLLQVPARVLRLQGGAGSGKSIGVAQNLLELLFKSESNRVFVFRKIARTVRDSVFLSFQDLIYENNLSRFFQINKSTHTITHNKTHNQIICGGMDDPEKIKSIKDPTVIWMEESTEFSFDDFTQLNLRLRKLNALNKIILSYNPIHKENWIYKHFEETRYAGEYFLKTTHNHNYFLPLSYRKELERLATVDANYYNVYALGEWGEIVKGLIFTNWEIIETFPEIETVYGLDFGYNDPMSLVKVGIVGDSVFVDCLYYEREKTLPEMMARFSEWGINSQTRIYADSARPGDIQQMYNAGYRLTKPAIKGPGSIVSGIQKLQTYKIFVTSRSTELIRELNRYKWEEDKNGELIEATPIDAFNHAIDALRYAVYTHTYTPPIHTATRKQFVPPKYKRFI